MRPPSRLTISQFTPLAAYIFHNIVLQVSEAIPSNVCRHIFAVAGATVLAGMTFNRLVE
jgi:hypothetical protein